MPQVQEQVGLRGRSEVEAAVGQVAGKRRSVYRAQCHRVREAVGRQPCLERRDAVLHLATAPPAAAGRRAVAVVQVDGLEPDDAAAQRAQREGPVEVHPEMAAALRVGDGVGRGEADGDTHEIPGCATGLRPSVAFNAVSKTRGASKCVSAISRAVRQWRR